MGTDLSTPGLLRRIALLEATVGRLSRDLGTFRSAVSKQGQQILAVPARSAPATQPAPSRWPSRGASSMNARGSSEATPWCRPPN